MKTKSTFRDSSFFLSFFVLVFTGFVTLAGPGDPKHPELLSNPVISPSSLNSGDDVIISSTPDTTNRTTLNSHEVINPAITGYHDF